MAGVLIENTSEEALTDEQLLPEILALLNTDRGDGCGHSPEDVADELAITTSRISEIFNDLLPDGFKKATPYYRWVRAYREGRFISPYQVIRYEELDDSLRKAGLEIAEMQEYTNSIFEQQCVDNQVSNELKREHEVLESLHPYYRLLYSLMSNGYSPREISEFNKSLNLPDISNDIKQLRKLMGVQADNIDWIYWVRGASINDRRRIGNEENRDRRMDPFLIYDIYRYFGGDREERLMCSKTKAVLALGILPVEKKNYANKLFDRELLNYLSTYVEEIGIQQLPREIPAVRHLNYLIMQTEMSLEQILETGFVFNYLDVNGDSQNAVISIEITHSKRLLMAWLDLLKEEYPEMHEDEDVERYLNSIKSTAFTNVKKIIEVVRRIKKAQVESSREGYC